MKYKRVLPFKCLYEVDNNVVLNFGEDILQPAVVEDTTPVAVETEVAVEVAAEIVPMVAFLGVLHTL